MFGLDTYMNGLKLKSSSSSRNSSPRTPSTPRTPTSTPTTPTAPTTPTYSAQNPPPGFTSRQWSDLLNMSKDNSTLAGLIKQFTGALGTPAADQTWRRQLPTSTPQLLKQLSYNAGEIGMPGGYVGGVQMPAYQTGGAQLPAINNPDMSQYGRQPGYGEATFYQQSTKGGMAPVAAMSPLGVPEGWNPGGTSTDDLKSQLEKYLGSMQQTQSSQAGKGWDSPFMGTIRSLIGPFA